MPGSPERGDRTVQTCPNVPFKSEETQQTSDRRNRTLLAQSGELFGAAQHKAGNMVGVQPIPIDF